MMVGSVFGNCSLFIAGYILSGFFRGRKAGTEWKKCFASVMVGGVQELDSCSAIVEACYTAPILDPDFKKYNPT